MALRSFPICLHREAMHLQCFTPTRYVRGVATRAHAIDDHYPLLSKLMYRLPACILYCVSSSTMWWFSDNFFLLSVWSPRKRRKNDNWLFFKQLILTCTIVLVNVLGLDRYITCCRLWISKSKLYLLCDVWLFVTYMGVSGPSLHIDSMIKNYIILSVRTVGYETSPAPWL